MKKAVAIACMLTIAAFPRSYAGDTIPVKHALVVAISDYAPASGFRHIFADNDVKIILKLLNQQGFTDTIVLRNSQATKEGFLKAFEKLRSGVHAGDIVFIQFSTHGQQLQDMNGDEPDGMDEAIALYNSRTTCTDGYKGENHLTDDEFGILVEQLRKDLGKNGDLLVMIDACHSGSMTRGEDISRIRGGYPPILYTPDGGKTVSRGDNPTEGKLGMLCNASKDNKSDRANCIIMSACENNEVSSEYYYNRNYFGPLTWAFLSAVLNSSGENYTYGKLFHDIQFKMISMFENSSAKQHPTLESAETRGADRIIFGGRNIVQQPYYTINAFQEPGLIRIAAGMLNGISDSTVVSLYPAGTTDPQKAGMSITKGKVIQSGYLESLVKLESPPERQDPGDYWIFVTSRKFSLYKLKIGLGSFPDGNLKKQASEELKNCSFVVTATEEPSYILRQKQVNRNEMVLEYAGSKRTCKESILVPDLASTLLTLAMANFLKEAQASSPLIDMDVAFLPVDTLREKKDRFLDPKTRHYTFREKKDTAVLQIVNTGKKSFYFNIIDIDPEGRVTVFIPNPGKPISECILQPGQKFRTVNTFSRPYGTEILKIIASEKKFDLRPVINTGLSSRGDSDDPEDIFGGLFGTRGIESVPRSYELATFNFFFDVVK